MQLTPNVPMVLGHTYEWADIVLSIGSNAPLVSIRAIDYSMKQDMKLIYGTGSSPIGRGYSNRTPEGSITILMDELVNLRAASPTSAIQDIPPFTITVSWLDTENTIVTNRLLFCKFMDDAISTKQGDASTEIKLTLSIGDIQYS